MVKKYILVMIYSWMIAFLVANTTESFAEVRFYKEKACPNSLTQQLCKDQCKTLYDVKVDIDLDKKIIILERSFLGLNIGTIILERCNINDENSWSCTNKMPGYYIAYKGEKLKYVFSTILSDGTVTAYNCAD